MLYGVSYYPEYMPHDRLAEDVAMMRAAHLTYVRLADSIWALAEPAPGRIDVEMLGPTLDALHGAGIRVVLCTPTYAIPAWMAAEHPEVMLRRADGTPWPYGDRQNADFTHPGYRFYAERIIRALMERWADHPAVIGVQVDNETGGRAIHSPGATAEFRRRLDAKFGGVERLNEVWGLAFWSHRLSDLSQLWEPGDRSGGGGNTNPGYDLEWRRFQADLVAEFLEWQARIVREYLREDQFVTHDSVGGHGLPHADRRRIGQVVDVPAENFPHHSQDALAHPPHGTHPPTYHDPSGVHGAIQLFQRADMARASGNENFLVTEINPLSVGGSAHNFPGYDGQWRLAAYACISRGANAVAYWHWHSLHYGSETYSHGVLGHDLRPNRNLAEITRTGEELACVGDDLTDLSAEADVCMLHSQDSRYLLEFEPFLAVPGTAEGDRRSYQRVFDSFYRGFFDVRAQLTVRDVDAGPADLADLTDLAEYALVVAPTLYSSDDATAGRLLEYAAAGGHLVLGPRSGYMDEFGRARAERGPGPLREGVGAGYSLYSTLEKPLPLTAGGALELEEGAAAVGWMDELELEGAEPLAHYEHHTFGRHPAIVTHAHGRGRITYLGTVPNAELARSVARWALDVAGIDVLGTELPEPVRVTRARRPDGVRLWFVTNWSHDAITVPAPTAGRTVLADRTVAADAPLTLDPWDVTVLEEDSA